MTGESEGCASCERRRFKSHARARLQKWTSPAGNSIKYLKRPGLTVKNCKIIKFTREMRKSYCPWRRLRENRSAGPQLQKAIERCWLRGPTRGRGGLVLAPPPHLHPNSPSTGAPNQDSRFFRGNFLSGVDRMRDVAGEGHGLGNKWMADPPVDRQLEIRVSRGGLPSAVKLKGLWFPEMRVISQPCLKMCQQPGRDGLNLPVPLPLRPFIFISKSNAETCWVFFFFSLFSCF